MFLFRGEEGWVGVIPRSQKILTLQCLYVPILGYVKDKSCEISEGMYRTTAATAGKGKGFELARIAASYFQDPQPACTTIFNLLAPVFYI
jgi:hypothetical protein